MFDLDAESAEVRAMPRCLRCGGAGWYNEMGPNTFPISCSCRESLEAKIPEDLFHTECRCCHASNGNLMDRYGRCHKCMDMVPDRGGWRQLGVYDG